MSKHAIYEVRVPTNTGRPGIFRTSENLEKCNLDRNPDQIRLLGKSLLDAADYLDGREGKEKFRRF